VKKDLEQFSLPSRPHWITCAPQLDRGHSQRTLLHSRRTRLLIRIRFLSLLRPPTLEEEVEEHTIRFVPILSFVKFSTQSSISPNVKSSLIRPTWIQTLTLPNPMTKNPIPQTTTHSNEMTMEWLSKWTESNLPSRLVRGSPELPLTVLDLHPSPEEDLRLPSRNAHL